MRSGVLGMYSIAQKLKNVGPDQSILAQQSVPATAGAWQVACPTLHESAGLHDCTRMKAMCLANGSPCTAIAGPSLSTAAVEWSGYAQ
jgi:hypothetical protein